MPEPKRSKDAGQRVRRFFAQLRHLPWALALTWRAARGWTIAWLALLLIQGLLPVATVFLTKAVVDALAHALGRGLSWDNALPVVVVGAAIGGVLLTTELLRALESWVRANQAEPVKEQLARMIHRQSVELDLAFYETPEYYDHLHRARLESQQRPLMLLEQSGSLLQGAVSLLAMLAVLVPLSPWLPLALLISTLPALYVVVRYAIRHYQWRLQTTAAERRSRYFDYMLATHEAAPELRIFDLGGHFSDAFQKILRELRGGRLRLMRNESFAQLGASAFALLVTAVALVWMVARALRGQATLGDLALFYQAFNQGQRVMRSALQQAGQLFGNVLFLGDLSEFMTLEPSVTDPAQPQPPPENIERAVRFEGVSFRYPSSDELVLEGFELEIPAGKTVAIVGVNGAGKSTLIKLLGRLYDPAAGRVTFDGIDLRALRLADLRALVTVLFQQPVQYAATVADNIAFGNLRAAPDRAAIEAAAEAAGADGTIVRLPQGFDTLLGTRFAGGHELSVGEWQRICLARAILRDAPLVLLDEPTSAMDSWAEAHWMERFRAHMRERTVLLITHRFTTAMHADIIHVMHEGRIVQSGTHASLVGSPGRYADSWNAQVQRHAGHPAKTTG